MTNREVMQQALEALDIVKLQYTQNRHVNEAITALKTALAQEHAMHELARLGQEIEQEPTPWRDMVVVSLVREGIDKHRARELADHFAAQPEQEPVAYFHPYKGFYWAKPTSIFAPTSVDVERLPLYTTAAQREWQSLTDEDWEKVANRKNTVLDTFEQGAVWAAYKLERRNT